MNSQQIAKAYADLCARVQPDFYFVLNYQPQPNRAPHNYEQLSVEIRKLFYALECDEWGYDERKEKQIGALKCRIERAVCIEKASAYHANVMMKRYGSQSDEALLEHIKRTWLDIQHRGGDWSDDYLFQLSNNNIVNQQAVCLYGNKDTAKANKRGEDVLCLRASFIRKHSNKR
jgi:hypothetical protein